jgi:F1F0 ATPase subunit 2
MTTDKLIYVLGGLAVGLAAGGVYLLILRWSVRRLMESRKAGGMLLSAPVRMAIPVLALVLVAAWDDMALLGAAAGLLLMQVGAQLFVRRGRKSDS